MNDPINVILLMLVIFTYGGLAALRYSPEALDRIARKMRARSRALVASRESFATVYAQSMADDARAEAERQEMRSLFHEVTRGGRK